MHSDNVVTVQVVRILPFGLLAKLPDGRQGIVRQREMAWDLDGHRHWRERYRVGDALPAVILRAEPDGRLELSLRLAHDDPWLDLADRLAPGTLIEGIVAGIQPYGIFVEVEPSVTGLAHRSTVPAWAHGEMDDLFWPGDHVQAVIAAVDVSGRRLSLDLRRAWAQRWAGEEGSAGAPARGQSAESNGRALPAGQPTRLPLELLASGQRTWSILLVEDDAAERQAVATWLQRAGQEVRATDSVEQALPGPADYRPDMVLMDLRLPGQDGIDGLARARELWPAVKRVLMTDWASADERMADLEALQEAGGALLLKPLLPEDLLSVLLTEVATVPEPSSPPTARQLAVATAVPDALGTAPSTAVREVVRRLRRLTLASKAILFAIDPAQRKVAIVAESGRVRLRPEAVADLLYSPVRDVAEDRCFVRVEQVEQHEARIRYLRPLLPFQSCLGVPVDGDLAQHHALFLFFARPQGFGRPQEEFAQASALALAALLEQQLFRERAAEMQRLALLGHLSRALVHEINHQLSPIGFALEMLEDQCARLERQARDAPQDVPLAADELRGHLQHVTRGMHKLIETARLFGQLTVHASEELLRLDVVIEEVVSLLRDMADRALVELEIEPAPNLCFTRAQGALVQQVLLNMVLNAIQQIAIVRPAAGGRVRIQLGQQRREEGPGLRIAVVDDGPGIHRRLWDRIFELGFTTRQAEGSGLGLYVSRSLVEVLGGRIYVAESRRLWGSTVVLELPFNL